ncbi:hypothetical protein D3C80_2102600 [compost metagenome]
MGHFIPSIQRFGGERNARQVRVNLIANVCDELAWGAGLEVVIRFDEIGREKFVHGGHIKLL